MAIRPFLGHYFGRCQSGPRKRLTKSDNKSRHGTHYLARRQWLTSIVIELRVRRPLLSRMRDAHRIVCGIEYSYCRLNTATALGRRLLQELASAILMHFQCSRLHKLPSLCTPPTIKLNARATSRNRLQPGGVSCNISKAKCMTGLQRALRS